MKTLDLLQESLHPMPYIRVGDRLVLITAIAFVEYLEAVEAAEDIEAEPEAMIFHMLSGEQFDLTAEEIPHFHDAIIAAMERAKANAVEKGKRQAQAMTGEIILPGSNGGRRG